MIAEKCDCGNYTTKEDLEKSQVSQRYICSNCLEICPNCGRRVYKGDILFTNKCIMCDEDF